MHTIEAIGLLILFAYGLFHHRHYRRRRRMGFGVWASLPGPFGTRETISKRWRG